MRNIPPYLFIVLILFSCKKEKSFDPNNPNGGGGTVASLLTKTVTQEGSDSLRVFYIYDSQKRFISYQSEESESGLVYKSELKFARNAQGIVQKIIVKRDDLVFAGIDSVFYLIHYNTSS